MRDRSPQRLPQLRIAFASAVCLLLGGFLVSGCAYRLGSTNPELTDGQSIQIAFFENRTIEPRLSEALNQALRRQIQQDGSYELDTQGEGDILVKGVIDHYIRSGLSYDPDDVLTAKDYSISVSANLTAIDRRTGRILVQETVNGRTSVRAGPDQVSVERQALPLLADDWARKAVAVLAEGSW